MKLHDTDMTIIGEPTSEQISAADESDGGWIWIDPEGAPVNITDYDDETVTIDYGPIGNFGKGVGETVPREGHRQVCIA